jgi:ribosomal protein L7/L12
MKITITENEAKSLIANSLSQFGVTSNDVVIVSDTQHQQGMNPVEAIIRVQRQFPQYLTGQKIAAIKQLRTYVPSLGLLAAKIAMEHPEVAIDNYLRTGNY